MNCVRLITSIIAFAGPGTTSRKIHMRNEPIEAVTDWSLLGEVVSQSSVGVLALDDEYRIITANARLGVLLDRDVTDLVGRDAHDVLHGSLCPRARCSFDLAAQAGTTVEIENDILQAADGRAVPVTWVASPLRGRSGISVILRDDTVQRERAVVDEAALAQGRAELADARQSIAELEWAAELSQSMSATLDEADALMRMARIVANRFADVVVADLHAGDGTMRRVGAATAPGVEVEVELDSLLGSPDVPHPAVVTSRTSERLMRGQMVRLAGAELDDPALVTETSRAVLRACRATAVLFVPLLARDRVVAAVALVRQASSPLFDAADELLIADVARRAALAIDNARLYREQRDIAMQLQHALLPAPTTGLPVRIAVRYLPARDRYRVGGDWYDVFPCGDNPDRSVLVIGDVAGHDLPAATTMAAIRNLLRGVAVATTKGCADVVDAVDTNLATLGIRGIASVVMMTATSEDDGGWTLTWTNAGHLPPLLLRPDAPAVLLDAVHGPLLGTQSGIERREQTLRVPGGSTIVLYTDGLVETRTAPLSAGLARLRQSADAIADLRCDPEAVLGELLGRNHSTDEDDTAILVAHLPVRQPAQ